MASPWAKIQTDNQAASFEEIEAEELVKSQQEREFQKYAKTQPQEEIVEKCEECALDGTDSDAVIAQLLQNQYNREYDLMLKRTEDKFNGASKVNISYSNYRAGPTMEPEEKAANIDEEQDWDRFVSVEKEYADIKRRGYKKIGEGSEIVTKHDMLMSSRINACRVLEFPPGIQTGDTGGFDAKLNNKVFNSLRAHSHAHCARQKAKARPHTK